MEVRLMAKPRALHSGLADDVRLALRSLQRRPWSALTVVLTLGLAIGSATATYAVFNHVVFRPVPGVVDEERLVTLYYQPNPSTPMRTSVSYAHLAAMRDQSPALDGLVAWAPSDAGFATTTGTAPDSRGARATERSLQRSVMRRPERLTGPRRDRGLTGG
jgi:hypothetical protein